MQEKIIKNKFLTPFYNYNPKSSQNIYRKKLEIFERKINLALKYTATNKTCGVGKHINVNSLRKPD